MNYEAKFLKNWHTLEEKMRIDREASGGGAGYGVGSGIGYHSGIGFGAGCWNDCLDWEDEEEAY